MATDLSIRRKHALRAFNDAGAVLPDVEVQQLWCNNSVWLTAWGAKVFHEFAAPPADAGKKKRKTSFTIVKDANHFVSSCALS